MQQPKIITGAVPSRKPPCITIDESQLPLRLLYGNTEYVLTKTKGKKLLLQKPF